LTSFEGRHQRPCFYGFCPFVLITPTKLELSATKKNYASMNEKKVDPINGKDNGMLY